VQRSHITQPKWRERAREPNRWASPRVVSACQRRKESEREEQVV
jgi:hypothetical protein